MGNALLEISAQKCLNNVEGQVNEYIAFDTQRMYKLRLSYKQGSIELKSHAVTLEVRSSKLSLRSHLDTTQLIWCFSLKFAELDRSVPYSMSSGIVFRFRLYFYRYVVTVGHFV